VSSFSASRRSLARPMKLGNKEFQAWAAYKSEVFAAKARPEVCYEPDKSIGHSPAYFGATTGVHSNYAIKGTSV
jgi:hypothetical protein